MIGTSLSRTLLVPAFIMWHCALLAQSTCIFSEHFDGAGLPAGWTSEPDSVELIDGNGTGTGLYAQEPWRVGTAGEANSGGYFAVPDQPAANTFAMANDDAAPCDCDLSGTALRSPAIDLGAVQNAALSVRVYHDGFPFNTEAWIEASADGNSWTIIEEIPALSGSWQERLLDLGAFDGGPLHLRFRFDDNGAWASGFAVDDVCVFERLTNDIAIADVWLGDRSGSPFTTSERSLGYSRMPLEQQSPLVVSVRVRNIGTSEAVDVTINGTISVDGGPPFQLSTMVLDTLAPLTDPVVQWTSGWTSFEAGEVTIGLSVAAQAIDEEPADNGAQLGYTITSVDEGNNTMSLDNDLPESFIEHAGEGFSAGCRFELLGGSSVVRGISVRFGTGTTPGSSVKAVLSDPNLNVLSVSAEHVITETDLALSFSGGTAYIPLDSAVDITTDQDVLAFVQFDGDTGSVSIAAGGDVPTGAAFKVETDGFDVTYPQRAPLVRIHFSEPVTGIAPWPGSVSEALRLFPNPASSGLTITGFDAARSGRIQLIDGLGREVRNSNWTAGQGALQLDLTGVEPGYYVVRAMSVANGPAGTTRTVGFLVVE